MTEAPEGIRPVLDDTVVKLDLRWIWRAFLLVPEEHAPESLAVGFQAFNFADDNEELARRYYENEDLDVISEWKPTPPEGRVIVGVTDTEDGPYALHIPSDHPRLSQYMNCGTEQAQHMEVS